MTDKLEIIFRDAQPDVDFCSLRFVDERSEVLGVRQDIPEPVVRSEDRGAMVTVVNGGGLGYGATTDLSPAGIRRAFEKAADFASMTAGSSVVDFAAIEMPCPVGEYIGPEEVPWKSMTVAEKFDMLVKASSELKIDDRIVDWESSLMHTACEMLYLTSAGARVRQQFSFIVPALRATANEGSETQTRTMGSVRGCSRQGGMEQLDEFEFTELPGRIAAEAVELLGAENCPSGKMDLLLTSDQMMLQIHESIGHPLELDRILGDERNYAGTSFVTPDMFGTYQYGSELLNICFDPTRPKQFATFGYDDDGLEAKKTYIIREGILLRGIGGVTSGMRLGVDSTASSRASSWNRPPIDRMANLNLEVGDKTLDELISSIERGVLMRTNRSWSIDDSRNKFQFGCEYAELIEDGKRVKVLKNPNYRGISAIFWRNLAGVGDESTFGIYGTPYCGKGEPNQCLRVGHASPACLFRDVDVFGGE
jgi:predicted Zn-dependent protease